MKTSRFLLNPLLMGILTLTLPCLAESGFPPKAIGKKGVGIPERKGTVTVEQMQALHLDWYYNWGPATELTTSAAFVPMIYSPRSLQAPIQGDCVLGYNEPDHPKQANTLAAEALSQWPSIVSKARLVGSPAMAQDPLKSEWLREFLAGHPKIDFITVHWYKGADPAHFIRDMEAIHAAYRLPIWVTEFAPQTAGDSEREPGKYPQSQVDRFIRETTRWMDRTPWVQRYAWHDSRVGTSALFDSNGGLTHTGKTYAIGGAGH